MFIYKLPGSIINYNYSGNDLMTFVVLLNSQTKGFLGYPDDFKN